MMGDSSRDLQCIKNVNLHKNYPKYINMSTNVEVFQI